MGHRDAALQALEVLERDRRSTRARTVKRWVMVAATVSFLAWSWYLAQVDLVRLVNGLPRLSQWLALAWPPKLEELPVFLVRTGETIAMAAIGTAVATLLAIPTAVLASRNIAPIPGLRKDYVSRSVIAGVDLVVRR